MKDAFIATTLRTPLPGQRHSTQSHITSLPSLLDAFYNAVIDVKAARSRNREAKGGGTKE